MENKYPIYIVSKGRADTRLTSKALERMNVPYRIVIESQEYDSYAAVIDPAKILILDPEYQRIYDTCGETPGITSKGSGPARNFAGDHSRSIGAASHWVMDDNIAGFVRWNHNRRISVVDGAAIACMEDFADRYSNIAMAGPAERYLPGGFSGQRPFRQNTRVYSCNLIRNDVPFRWRGRYNEDTILSLDMLKAGYCTILFHAVLQNKISTTAKMKGGNTDTIYVNGTLEKSQMLARVHPDVARVVWKFNRWHHHVDYRPFKKNRLIRRTDIEWPTGTNEYGMQLVKVGQGSAVPS